jgi:uncharacterized zinc-type alcohol dehydrogenase-like protein
MIGGIKNTQECIDFCAKHQIFPDTQVITADKIDWAWEELNKGNKEGIRYVIDIQASLQNPENLPK